MNLKHKPVVSFRINLLLLFLFIAASFIVSNSSTIFADDEKGSEVMAQNTNNEKGSEVTPQLFQGPELSPQQIKDLEVITINNKGYKKDRKGPAKFDHVKHARDYKISCWECHHEYKDNKQTKKVDEAEEIQQAEQTEKKVDDVKNVENVKNEQNEKTLPKELTAQNIWSPWGKTKKCIECHDPVEKKNDTLKLQAAYHINCKTCHKERRIYGNDYLAYRKCTTCHTD